MPTISHASFTSVSACVCVFTLSNAWRFMTVLLKNRCRKVNCAEGQGVSLDWNWRRTPDSSSIIQERGRRLEVGVRGQDGYSRDQMQRDA